MLTASEHIRTAHDIIVNGKDPLLPSIHPMYVTDPMTGKCPRRQQLSSHLNVLAHVCERHEASVGRMEDGEDDVAIATPIAGSVVDEIRVVTEHLRSALQIVSVDKSDWSYGLIFQLEELDILLGATEIYMSGDEATRTEINSIINSVQEQEAKNPGSVIPRVDYNTDLKSPNRGYKIINRDFDDPMKRFVDEYRETIHAEI